MNVKTKTGVDLVRFSGFIEFYRAQPLVETKKAHWLKVVCNGWKLNERDSWQYLESGQYLAGIYINRALYVCLNDEELIVRCD